MFDTLGGYTQVKSSRQARRSPIGYGGLYEGVDEPISSGGIPLEERDQLLNQLEEKTPQFTSTLFELLNKPVSYGLDILTGRPIGSGTTGEKFLDDLGLLPSEQALGGWGRPLAGAGVEMALDPLSLVSFGGGAVSKAARAAKAANVFDDVTRVASRKLISNGGDLGKYGENALEAFQKHFPGMGLEDLTDGDLAARPLVGPRVAARNTTLDELVKAQPVANQAQVMNDIENFLSRSGSTYADVAGQKLGGDIGFRLPLSDTSAVFQIPGIGPASARGFDRLGQAIRWSAPGRHLYSAFDNKVLGTVDEGDQILAQQLSKADKAGDIAARAKLSGMLMDMPEEAFDPRVSSTLRRVIENVATPADLNFMRTRPELQRFASKAGQEFVDYLKRSRAAGIGSAPLIDKWGTQYFPRSLDKHSFEQQVRGSAKGGKNYSVMTGDQLARAKAYHVPGGTDTLQQLSLDPNVAGPSRVIGTDRDAAVYIKRKLDAKAAQMFPSGRLPNGKPAKYSLRSAEKLARMLNQIKPDAIKKGYPIFGAHVTEDMARYFSGRERAMQRANVLYDILGSRAKRNNYLDASGQMPVTQAMRNLKLKTYDQMGPVLPGVKKVEGAADNLLQRLQTRGGFSGVALDELKDISIDKRLMQRLNRIADFYHSPEVQSKFLEFVDGATRMWKASILSWPARFTRDWYSGMFSNILEVGSPSDLMRGYAGAKYVLQGQWDRADSILEMMPRYSGLNRDERRRRFLKDLAASGLLQGRRITDLGGETAARASGKGLLNEVLPGTDPQTTLGYQVGDLLMGRKPVGMKHSAYSELGNIQNWKAQPAAIKRMVTLSGDASDELTNPVLRWSAKLGDTTDSINRLSGYMALMTQGLNPQAAAAKIKLSQVDYGSLTKVEREWFRRVVPFWAYTSRISKYVGGQLWNDPGGRLFQLGIRLPERLAESNDEDNSYVPASIRQKYGLSLEPMRNLPGLGPLVNAIAPPKEGVSAWLSDIDFPGIDQLNMVKLATDLEGRIAPGQTAWKTFQSMAGGNLHPYLKTGVEAMTGQDLYTQRPKSTSESTLQAIGRRTGSVARYSAADNLLGSVDPLVQLVPFAPRVLQLARRAVDSERVPVDSARFAQNAFNMFTGTKIQNVSDDVRRYDALQKIQDIIGDNPNVRRFEQAYIPEEALPFTDPEVVRLYALQRQLNREQRMERKPPKSVELSNPLLY